LSPRVYLTVLSLLGKMAPQNLAASWNIRGDQISEIFKQGPGGKNVHSEMSFGHCSTNFNSFPRLLASP
jgi:hypothetical protein